MEDLRSPRRFQRPPVRRPRYKFGYNPGTVYAHVEGRAIEVTGHGETIPLVAPGLGVPGRYTTLIASGIIRLKPTTTRDLDQIPGYEVPGDSSALETLLAERDADSR